MHAPRTVVIVLAASLVASFAIATEPEPTVEDVTSYFQESVNHYAAGDFEQSLRSAEASLKLLEQQVAIAYNNICSAQMQLGALDEAAAACNKALQLAPEYQRAWSNLAWVYAMQADRSPSAGAYLNLSLAYYWQDALAESIQAAETALGFDPRSAIAHNNICAARAKGGEWKLAVRACKLALKIDPDYELAKNNLRWAKTRKADDID